MTGLLSTPGRSAAWILLILVVGCGPGVETATPLLDTEHRADFLVEEAVLSRPGAVAQNRLLRGWRYSRRNGVSTITPVGTESVVELSVVECRPRTLVLTLAGAGGGDTPAIRARAGNRTLGTFTASGGKVEVPLPADLGPGRVAVALEPSGFEGVTVSRVAVRPCLSPGSIEITDDGIRQSGWSAVEVVQRVRAGSRLVAELAPPSGSDAGQSFAVVVDRGHGPPREHPVWSSTGSTASTPSVGVSMPLGDRDGLVRIRLVARGEGPPARWMNARVLSPPTSAPQLAAKPLPKPPRLVVVYVMDALRADHVGHLGSRHELTPVLDGLAASGVSFERHFAVAPNTAPSTRALFSGLCMLDDRQLPHPGPERVAETFTKAGYRTACITGNPNLGPSLDLSVGFESVELLRVVEDHHPDHQPTVNISAELLRSAALDWIGSLDPTDRAFLYIHTMNPHNPYTPPPELEVRFAPHDLSAIDGRTRTLTAIRDRKQQVSENDIERIRNLYAAGVAYNDRELGLLLGELERRFDPGEVLLIVTSDHGEELFEHGGVLHGYTLFDEMLRIPLIVSWPGQIEPLRIGTATTTLDLHATLVGLAGARRETPAGRSLWPAVLGDEPPSAETRLTFAAAPGLDGAVMVRCSRWKLIQAPRGGANRGQGHGRGRSWDLEYLFDLETDPGERHNRAGLDSLETAWLRSRLTAWIETQRALQPAAGESQVDSATKEQLKALGYVVE